MFYDAFYNTSHAKTAVIVQEIFYFNKEQEQYRNNIMTDNSAIYFPQCHAATIVIEDKTAQGKQTKTSWKPCMDKKDGIMHTQAQKNIIIVFFISFILHFDRITLSLQ